MNNIRDMFAWSFLKWGIIIGSKPFKDLFVFHIERAITEGAANYAQEMDKKEFR